MDPKRAYVPFKDNGQLHTGPWLPHTWIVDGTYDTWKGRYSKRFGTSINAARLDNTSNHTIIIFIVIIIFSVLLTALHRSEAPSQLLLELEKPVETS